MPIIPQQKHVKRLEKLSTILMEPYAPSGRVSGPSVTSELFKNLLNMNIVNANTMFIKIASLRFKIIAAISEKNISGRAVEDTNLPTTLHKSSAMHSKR